MPVVLRRDVSRDVLVELLGLGAESEQLDYKKTCDLVDNDEFLELAKDILAMQAYGGYIVIGAADDGSVVGLDSGLLHAYDESKLTAKLRKYVDEPFEILLQTHEVEEATCALVFVAPRSDGFAVAKIDAHGTKKRPVFRKGDVLVRRGTASERCSQADVARILDRLVSEAKAKWQHEVAQTWEHAMRGQTLARGPVHALSWQLDPGSLQDVLVEQLRTGDEIPLRTLMRDAVRDAKRLASEGSDDWRLVLDAITAVAAVGIDVQRPDVVSAAIKAFHGIYYAELDQHGMARRGQANAAGLWLEVIVRVLALGGFAVRMDDWNTVRSLAVQTSDNDDWERYATWVRHALTMAARSNLFDRDDGERKWKESLIRLAQRYADEHDFVRPDLDAEDEGILNSICQFDLLVALASYASSNGKGADYYPNFFRFHSHRTEPAAERLLRNRAMRDILFPLDDDSLARALRIVDGHAQREGFSYNGWDGYMSRRVTQFLAEHPEPSEA